MATAADPEISTLTDYENLPVVHLRIRSARALERLRRQAKIRSIDAINGHPAEPGAEPARWSGNRRCRRRGATGAGTTVAVLDTGVDFSRAAFGSCSAPGGACKVAYAQDFAAQDNSRDANGHGTKRRRHRAGCGAGRAHRRPRRVREQWRRLLQRDHQRDQLDHQQPRHLQHRRDQHEPGPAVRYYAPMAPTDAWGTAIANAVNAGIAVVVASGNEAYSDSIAAPAAYSNVISVGAAYDSSMGGIGWSRCSDASSSAWKITCFSNSASFLTMLAPGSQITAAGITQSGTSQATPHVAGAVAVLKAAFPDETVAQITNRLKLGPTITDPRNNVTKPRLDLAAALAEPPSSYRLTVVRSGNGTVTSSPAGISCGTTCRRQSGQRRHRHADRAAWRAIDVRRLVGRLHGRLHHLHRVDDLGPYRQRPVRAEHQRGLRRQRRPVHRLDPAWRLERGLGLEAR